MQKVLAALSITVPFLCCATSVFAAAPDGPGPWADTVLSSSQGVMKNGLPVPPERSEPTEALGIPENLPTGGFFSLGFGGNIILGFDNGMSNGAIIIESTFPDYPGETATVDMSQDGVVWINAGSLVQDGTVEIEQPDEVSCARYIRITDTSDPIIFPDDIADGYDVDAVQTIGDLCDPEASPTPTPTPLPVPTPTPSTAPSSPDPTSNPSPTACIPRNIDTVPSFLEASRVSATSMFLSWGPYAGFNDFVIQYGFEDGVWLFNTKVSGFSTTINDLPANQAIWFQIAATDNCINGSFSGSVLVGGSTTVSNLATLVPGFPETGGSIVPRLPNTGLSPKDSNTDPMSMLRDWLTTIIFYLGFSKL